MAALPAVEAISMLEETPFFFGTGSRNLFGVLHQPASRTDLTPFVFCHPFGEEKLWAHRIFVTFARELARRGRTVLRFDYLGNGDSSGDFSDWTLEIALANIGEAIHEVRRRTSSRSVGVMGLRLGASLASQIADVRDDVERLVLWSPIVHGGRYMQELLRINLTTQMSVYGAVRVDREGLVEQLRQGHTANVDGYEVSPALFEQVSALALLSAQHKSFPGPCLIAQIERSENAPPLKDLQELQRLYPRGAFRIVKEEPFWKETIAFCDTTPNLFNATLEWLDPK
jgi:exosortase A-associated hydrolase 2